VCSKEFWKDANLGEDKLLHGRLLSLEAQNPLAAGGALGVLAGGAGGANDEHVAAFAAVLGVGRHDDCGCKMDDVFVLRVVKL